MQYSRIGIWTGLSGVATRVPTLRERRADVFALANHFLDRHRTTRLLRLSTAAADALVTAVGSATGGEGRAQGSPIVRRSNRNGFDD
jgi:transcriptional regulator of aromatic amino acid metabolism